MERSSYQNLSLLLEHNLNNMKRTQTLLRLLATAPKPKVVKRSNLYDESDTLKFNRNKILLFTALDYQQKNIIT